MSLNAAVKPDFSITVCQGGNIRRRFELWGNQPYDAGVSIEGLINLLDDEFPGNRMCVDGVVTAGKHDGERLYIG